MKAKSLYEQALFALEILNQIRGEELDGAIARTYVDVLSRLGELERHLMNPARAKQYIEDSIRLRKKYFGNYHPLVSEGFHQLGYLLQTMNKPEAAVQVYAIGLTILTSIQKQPSEKLVALVSAIASCLRSLGREDDTIVYLREALHLMTAVYHSFDAPFISTVIRYACTTTGHVPKSFEFPGDGGILNSFGNRHFAVSLRPRDLIGMPMICQSYEHIMFYLSCSIWFSL